MLGSTRVVAACAMLALGASGCIFTARVDVNSAGVQGDNDVIAVAPAISKDGRFIAFQSRAANLGMVAPLSGGNVFKRDMQTNTTTPVSVPTNGPGFAPNGATIGEPAISDDGRYVAFASGASNLVLGDTNNVIDVFRRDTTNGTTVRVDLDVDGNQITSGATGGTRPSMSGNGRYVTFVTQAQVTTDDVPGNMSVYRKDMNSGAVVLVSKGNGFTDGTNPSMSPRRQCHRVRVRERIGGRRRRLDRRLRTQHRARQPFSARAFRPQVSNRTIMRATPRSRATARESSSSPRPRTSSAVTPTDFGTHSNACSAPRRRSG